MMSVDNYKVYFTGFPKDTCQLTDLYDLFSRVVQIKFLWISSRKGYGYITLYSESSVQFILQKDIQLNLNGCSIKLEEFTQKQKHGGTTQKQSPQILQEVQNFSRIEKSAHMSSTQPTIQHYKHCRSSFWKDVPHEKASLVIKKRKKKRLKTTRDYTLEIQTCKKIRKKKLKRRKKRKVKVSRMYHSAVGLHRDYSLIHSKIKEDKQCASIQRKICVANSNQCCKRVSQEFAKDITETDSDVNNPESCCTSGVNNPESCHTSDVNNPESLCNSNVNNPESHCTSDVNNLVSCHTSDVNNPVTHCTSDVNNPGSCHTSYVNNPETHCTSDVNSPGSCQISDVNNPQSCCTSDVNNPVSCHTSDVNNPGSCHTSDFNNPESHCTSDVNNQGRCCTSDVNNPVSCHSSVVKNPVSCHTSDKNSQVSCHIPLYVKIGEKIHLIYLPYHVNDSYKHICDFVHKEKGIPAELQLLIYQGKVLTGKLDKGIMEPYTTVEVIVKGKGGMMEASAYPLIITKESTEKDVFCWLQHVVKISDNVLSQYPAIKHLDGETLLGYEKNFIGLKQDIEVPIGIARKILLSLDSDFLKKWETSTMLSWSFVELMNFIKETIKEKEDCVLVEAAMKENFIDAMSFFSYEDSQTLKKDLNITNLSGVICTKLIRKRNTMLEKSESRTKLTIKAEEAAVEFESKSHVKEEKEISIHHQFLDNGLGLKKSENVKDFTSCKLFIIYSSWTNANDLEKMFLFFVLCHKDDFENKQSRSFLWNHIRKNVTLWLNELHQKERDKFKLVENSEDTFIYKGHRMSFSKGNVNTSFFMDKDIGKILQYACHVLLVSSKLLDSKSSFYECVLSAHTKQKCSTYDFMLDEDKEYWFFNPDDFADDFKKRRLNDLRLEYNQTNEEETKSINASVRNETACSKYEMEGTKIQNPRPFKEEATHILYHENRTLSIPESDGTLSDRCFEFKYFAGSLKSDSNFTKFVRETLRFSCGVLNARKNGTIFFGVGDNVQHEAGRKFKHGEIVGFPIKEENEDCKTKYTDVLRLGINKCFRKEVCSAALQCIKNPVFVTVLTDDKQGSKFVMEVDVCPLSNFCEDLSFRVNLNKYGEPSRKWENEHLLFLRDGSATKKLTGNEELMFLKIEFEKILKFHKEEEQSSLMNKKGLRESAFYKLQELFCGGLDKFDVDMWPIFVLSKPSDSQKKSKLFFKSVAFLRKIKSIFACFDFDENSDENGLSCHIRNKDETELYDESIFYEYSGQFDTLKSHLGIPREEKTIWIFSNGRSGILEPKPHFQQSEWRLNYRPGITDAISFFNQPYVIPKGRAMFIFLLFTNELDGVIDTFIDVISRFSLEQVIVLAEMKSVYNAFKTSVISEGGVNVDMLDKKSVYDVSWEQISTSLKSFLGEEDKGNCMLATSSGIPMPTEERFLETLSDLVVLSATQCENQDFGTDKMKKSQEEEFKFYRGNKVSWWNFYFETHVLKRHNFERLKDKIQRVLQSEIQDQRVVVTVTLLHEPGAGGSTIANNILWEFRKNYKCCIIRKITERTHIQLLYLWEFKEQNPDQANPLLILIDELIDTEYLYDHLVSKIHTEFRKRSCPSKPFCCIILCNTEEQLEKIPNTMTEILSERLYQKLTDNEQIWLETKFKELETTSTNSGIFGFKPEYLLSFMILRSGFNQEYIKKTIKSLLIKIQKFPNEFNLLKYTSLISCYVSSKHNGPKVHIPIDCCDELMGAQLGKCKHGWYETLSPTVKIFLLVEERNHKNGSQIRMAHPLLAKEVFKQIRELVGATIYDVASEFMESSLLKSNTHGILILEEITKEMLKRRKKLEHGNKLTHFSPLIEDILNENRCQYDKAIKLLIQGFKIFNSDYLIAQTIVCLCFRNKKFDLAAKWARDAVMLASSTGKSNCIYMLGHVLKGKFMAITSKLGKVEPSDAKEYLELAFEALNNFLQSQVGRDSFSPLRVLYSFNDTIHMINKITNFLMTNVQVPPRFEWKKYLSDPDYIPQELNEWGDFHEDLRNLQKHGIEAFDTLEEYVCFNTVFNSQSNEEASEQTRIFHRSYRSLQLQYPSMFSTFSEFFGESDPNEPESFPTEESKNQWHRRKVLHMKGNSFINIFQIFHDIKKKKLNKTVALDRMIKIHGHLSKITKRCSRDLCNLICVNFALALLDRKRESDETIYRYCTVVIRNNTYGVSLAHFFIMILLWPTSRMRSAYDDETFQNSMKTLHNDNQQKFQEKHPRGRYSPFKDDECVICQVTPQFFLTKERGFKSVCSRSEILFREQQDSIFDNTIWEKKRVKQKLKKLEGHVRFTQGCRNLYILLQNENSNQPIAIRNLRTGRQKILSEVKVTFYLGFSMAGPVAYNIKPVKHDILARYCNPIIDLRLWDEVDKTTED